MNADLEFRRLVLNETAWTTAGSWIEVCHDTVYFEVVDPLNLRGRPLTCAQLGLLHCNCKDCRSQTCQRRYIAWES